MEHHPLGEVGHEELESSRHKTQVVLVVKNLQETQETWVQFLGGEEALEEGMATHSSILAWGIPWTEEPGGLQSMGSQRVRHDWQLNNNGKFYSLSPLSSLKVFPSEYKISSSL